SRSPSATRRIPAGTCGRCSRKEGRTRTPPDGERQRRTGGMGRTGRMGRSGRMGQAFITVTLSCLPALPAFPAFSFPAPPPHPALSALVAQASFEETVRDLSSSDSDTRLRAALLLRDAADPEAALPLARAVVDTVDEVQLAAIAAELNIFLAEKLVPRKRVALVVEVRNQILAEPAFSAGPSPPPSAPPPPPPLHP